MCIGFPFDIFYSVLTYPGNQAQLLLMSGEMIKENVQFLLKFMRDLGPHANPDTRPLHWDQLDFSDINIAEKALNNFNFQVQHYGNRIYNNNR